MDAWHLLLGRPWKFERKVNLGGVRNAYTFQKEGATYKIQSPTEEDGSKQIGSNLMMVGEREFLDIMKEEGVGYALVLKPGEQKKREISDTGPEEVRDLMEKSIASDVPNSLPLVREISHQIDLISGGVLRNKAAYKRTPQQVEVARQVLELLDRGLIRKIFSPSAVPSPNP